jgi:hypothetical protein
MALLEASNREMVVQSRPTDSGRAQLLVASKLQPGKAYQLVLEFSEETDTQDRKATAACEYFILAAKSWSSKKTCVLGGNLPDVGSLPTAVTAGIDVAPVTVALSKQGTKRPLRVEGNGPVDLTLALDYSDAFYRPELALRLEGVSEQGSGGDDSERDSIAELTQTLTPAAVEFSRKQSTTYVFSDLQPGSYEIRVRQGFKQPDCASPFTLAIKAQKAASTSISLEEGQTQNLFQSQAEEQEAPRTASKLPLHLSTYKFGGQPSRSGSSASSGSVLFSGAVQLDELESQNRISFEVREEGTLVRMYAEHEGLAMTLSDSSSDHEKPLFAGSGSLVQVLSPGQYTV